MNSKLTLNIQDKELIEEAKTFAKSQNKSLSVLVENILRGLVGQKKRTDQTSGNKLLGAFVTKDTAIEKDKDPKWEFLKEKYGL